MVFTKIEIDIAKQILKLGLILIVTAIVISFLLNITDFIKIKSNIAENFVDEQSTQNNKVIEKTVIHENPLSIDIPDYNIHSSIESPMNTDVKVLDSALMRAAVYYPGSGFPGSDNMLIFGHSTGFKVVINKAYQVFNNIKTVKPGTLIYVKTQSAVHVYKTRDVKKVSKYTAWIQFKSNTPMLTLSTCDSFGKRSDRYVLEADYVGVQ